MSSGQDTSEVRQGHDIPIPSLEAYLVKTLPGFVGPLTVRQFKVGQSNPTFLVIDGTGKRFVVRKKPSGKLIATAHMIEREFQVLKALKTTGFPVPAVYNFCEDISVIGTSFYVSPFFERERKKGHVISLLSFPHHTHTQIMEFLEGRIFTDVTLEELSPQDRKAW